MADHQLAIAIQTDRVNPESQVSSCNKKQNNSTVGIGYLSVSKVDVWEQDQLEEKFGSSQAGYYEIEGVEGFLQSALGGLWLQQEEEGGDDDECLGQEGGCSFLVYLDQLAAHATI